jgi:hypothetical protein
VFLYYCVLKNYKGFLGKKHVGNTHALFCPISEDQHAILAITGKLEKHENTYTSVLIYKVPSDMVDEIILRQIDEFGWKYEKLDKIKVAITQDSPDETKIELLQKSSFIKSNLNILFAEEQSKPPVYIYLISGEIELMTAELSMNKLA